MALNRRSFFGRDLRFFGGFRGPKTKHGDAAGLLFPCLDQCGVVNDLYIALEIAEGHPAAEALLVQPPEGGLIAVVIGGPKQDAIGAAARDVAEIAFGGIALLADFDVILLAGHRKRGALRGGAIGPDLAILA